MAEHLSKDEGCQVDLLEFCRHELLSVFGPVQRASAWQALRGLAVRASSPCFCSSSGPSALSLGSTATLRKVDALKKRDDMHQAVKQSSKCL